MKIKQKIKKKKYQKKRNVKIQNNNNKEEDAKTVDENIKSHSPINTQDKIHKKKHIKVKFTRALTSKTSISSKKSEDPNTSTSGAHVKKMKIKNIVVNPAEFFRNYSVNIDRTIDFNKVNYNDLDTNTNIFKLLKLIDKLETKTIMFKYFMSWKKGKK